VETNQPRQFTFKCDSTSLDFIGTLKSRKEAQPIEVLVTPEDVATWFRESGIVDDTLAFTSRDLGRARELRAAVAAVVDAHLAGTAFPPDSLETLNDVAAKPAPVPRLTRSGRTISATPERAMSAIARDAIDILTGPTAELIKECSRDGCNQVYVDRSRGGRREWCSMDPCGNRIKAREYRARKSAVAG
jgi:predicted RNA-binding Zn ribbon-like protein